jgi:hypothetical protein
MAPYGGVASGRRSPTIDTAVTRLDSGTCEENGQKMELRELVLSSAKSGLRREANSAERLRPLLDTHAMLY